MSESTADLIPRTPDDGPTNAQSEHGDVPVDLPTQPVNTYGQVPDDNGPFGSEKPLEIIKRSESELLEAKTEALEHKAIATDFFREQRWQEVN